MALSVVLLLATLALAGLATLQHLDVRQRLNHAGRYVLRLQLRNEELRALYAGRERIARAQQFAEAGVALGAGTVKAIHQGIAAIPFTILEAIPVTRDTTRVVRVVHDGVARAVYGAIGGVNRIVGRRLRSGLGAPDEGDKSR